ncbi:MAG: 3-keto-5-aminohexanoate cleavage protein [Actinomycetota bacterium]|nr:3-keto-5-aminohexanoate cleavage protein [Actinomycetota bacterium]
MSAPAGGAGTEGVWLEAALNGAWTRRRQPTMPVTRAQIVEDAVACAEAGAAIVHVHAYDEDSGTPREAYEIYAPIFEDIRSRTDVICYPTVPMGPRPSAGPEEAIARYDVVERLARAGLIEWSVVDPGSVNLSTVAELQAGADGFLYANSASDVRAGLALCREHRLVPSYAVYEPGFLRAGAVLHDAVRGAPRPVYRFMFSTGFTFGFPPAEWALDTCLRMLDAADPGSPWMVAGLGVELDQLWGATIALGGHLRVGLEDAPLGCTVSNAELVLAAARAVQAAGRRLASAPEVRRSTGTGRPTDADPVTV